MGAHVSRQVAGVREGLTAGCAGVGAVAGMGAHVYCQVARVREGLTASSADVGAVAGMGAHVLCQASVLRECHTAGGTGAGAFACMGAHVSRQVAGLRDGLPAHGALENGLDRRPAPTLLALPIKASAAFTARRLIFPPTLVSDHLLRDVLHLVDAKPTGQITKKKHKNRGLECGGTLKKLACTGRRFGHWS